MPAIWTDGTERVVRVHNNPADVDTSAATIVDTQPPQPNSNYPWKQGELHYNSTDGFYYTYTDPISDWKLTDTQKKEVWDAMRVEDIEALKNAIQKAYK